MSTSGFDELALQFVLAEEKSDRDQIAERAADAIAKSANTRTAVAQWVASIKRWMQPSEDDNLVLRAAALEFLASTLECLDRDNFVLSGEQIQLLVAFFTNSFHNDHKAGVFAAAKSLLHLIHMKHFKPSLGLTIIESICMLADDFKLQAPATRLEIFRLLFELVDNPIVASNLTHQSGNSLEFMPMIISLCENERNPENIIQWFSILKVFLQKYDPSDVITKVIFTAFSSYFPISIRASSERQNITVDDLKVALRSCFSAHHCLAELTIPYLLNKLDQGDAISIPVKVDILTTLDACLSSYESPKQSVVPNADKIWNSLKYEVRNGEIVDAIKATLKALTSLTKRLDGVDLQTFLSNAWRDLSEDILEPKYTAPAGRLLVALSGATTTSFSLLAPRALELVKPAIKSSTSIAYKQDLITLVGSMLNLRLHLVDGLESEPPSPGTITDLSDDLFGDSLFQDLYWTTWEAHSAPTGPIEHTGILRETMKGLGALVGQKTSRQTPYEKLCSDSTCDTIAAILAKPIIICQVEGVHLLQSDNGEAFVSQDLLLAATEALMTAVPRYPPTFQHLLLQYLSSAQAMQELDHEALSPRLCNALLSLCRLIDSDKMEPASGWLNEAALINTILQQIHVTLSQRKHPKLCVSLLNCLSVCLPRAMEKSEVSDIRPLDYHLFEEFRSRMATINVPRIDENETGNIHAMELEEPGSDRPRRAFCLFVVRQLYRRFARVYYVSDATAGTVKIDPDLDSTNPKLENHYDEGVHRLGSIATQVIRQLTEAEQMHLCLDREIFDVFQYGNHLSHMKKQPILFSKESAFRVAPLCLGIAQGLWPKAIDTHLNMNLQNNLTAFLTPRPPKCSEPNRIALNELLGVLANKYNAGANEELLTERHGIQERLRHIFQSMREDDMPGAIMIARTILHYLAGDVLLQSRYHIEDEEGASINPNLLLGEVLLLTPNYRIFGRHLARDLGILNSPRESLAVVNHTVRTRLGANWFYNQAVKPLIPMCLPTVNANEEELQIIDSFAVGMFSMLQHVPFSSYEDDGEDIAMIGVRVMATLKIGRETEALLRVFLEILQNNAEILRLHIGIIINDIAAIYEMARNVADSDKFKPFPPKDAGEGKRGISKVKKGRDPIPTRKLTLRFMLDVTKAYETHMLLPACRTMMKPLQNACGDPVREIRKTAQKARQAWEDLSEK
ncbi:hypothetical protein F5Y18DRAFT_177814 [Xylariaceae sp. FL1019]|nr:hypothetical protein F5Y18DRAFT_177814 [Xylariaceae sp. FL1019]